MDAFAAPNGTVTTPGSVSLSVLLPNTVAVVRGVGSRADEASPLERRLIELGFVAGERVEVLTQARPGGDPFVLRIGDTTFALRRREVENVWVEISPSISQP
jgi:ferrous iron transport protein A